MALPERIIECLTAVGCACTPAELRSRSSSLVAGVDVLTATMSQMASDRLLVAVDRGRYALPESMSRREKSAASITPSRAVPSKIIALIEKTPMSAHALANALGMNEGAVGYHLTNLRKAGKIETVGGQWHMRTAGAPPAVESKAPTVTSPPKTEVPRTNETAIILDKIAAVHKRSAAIEPVAALDLKLAVLDKLSVLYVEDVAEVLTAIRADIKRLGDYAQQSAAR